MTPERRAAQRYTLSHLAHDVKNQTGIGEPVRDWFPISFMGSFTDWADVTHGAEKEFGQLTCGCHPNCGVGMAHHDRQGNQGSGAGHRVPQGRAARQGRRLGERRRPRPVPVGLRHGARAGPQLRLVQVADALQADRPAEEVRQDVRRRRRRPKRASYGKIDRRPHHGRHREAPRRSLELPVHRRHVVPGSVQLRLPPHRDVHHPVCDAAGRNLLLRLQHRASAGATSSRRCT